MRVEVTVVVGTTELAFIHPAHIPKVGEYLTVGDDDNTYKCKVSAVEHDFRSVEGFQLITLSVVVVSNSKPN